MSRNLKEAAQKNQSVKFKNSIQKSRTIKMTFVADNDQATASVSPVYLFAGKGDIAKRSLPAGVTIGAGSDYGTIADWHDMMGAVKFGVESIKLETADTDNYEGTTLTVGKRNLNRRNNQEQDLFLSDFQVSNGNGLKQTANIDIDALDGGFMVNSLFTAVFNGVKKNTSVTFYIKVSHEEAATELDPADF